MDTLDPCSNDDINNDVSSHWPKVVEETDSKPTLSKLGCCADRFVDQFQLNMTQATIRAVKSGDSMLKASLGVQLFGKERNSIGNLKATTTQMKNVGLTFSIYLANTETVTFKFQCIL